MVLHVISLSSHDRLDHIRLTVMSAICKSTKPDRLPSTLSVGDTKDGLMTISSIDVYMQSLLYLYRFSLQALCTADSLQLIPVLTRALFACATLRIDTFVRETHDFDVPLFLEDQFDVLRAENI